MTESRSASTYDKEESFSNSRQSRTKSYEGSESVSTSNDTATKSQNGSSGMHYSTGTHSRSYITGSDDGEGQKRVKIRPSYEIEDRSSVDESSEWSKDETASKDPNTNGEYLPSDKELDQFDRLVEKVRANDPSFKDIVLLKTSLIGNLYGSEELWNALVGNTFIKHLSIRGCNMTDEEAASLSIALMDNKSISHIWLGYNDITSEGVEYLIATLESNNSIVYLELDGNEDIDPGLEEEIRSILEPREEAYGSRPEIDAVDEVGQLMERVCNNDCTLTKLNLSSMGIGTRPDALTMFDALADNTYIQTMDLSNNEVDDDCVSSISMALIENKSITHLNLADNAISSEGAEYLIGTLNANETLREIKLSGNQIDNVITEEIHAMLNERQGAASSLMSSEMSLPVLLQRVIGNDQTLTQLELDNRPDDMKSQEIEAIIKALAENNFVTKLSLCNNDLDDNFVADLSMALVYDNTITHVFLRDNRITSEGCEYLLATLESNETIIFLDLSGNIIDENLMNEVDELLSPRQIRAGLPQIV